MANDHKFVWDVLATDCEFGPDGAFYVSAIVLMDMEGGPEARTFALPVMVGAPADVAQKPKPSTDATGQPIESLPGT